MHSTLAYVRVVDRGVAFPPLSAVSKEGLANCLARMCCVSNCYCSDSVLSPSKRAPSSSRCVAFVRRTIGLRKAVLQCALEAAFNTGQNDNYFTGKPCSKYEFPARFGY